MATPGLGPLTGSPRQSARPEVGFSRPAMMRSSDDQRALALLAVGHARFFHLQQPLRVGGSGHGGDLL
jgi:hypothetical protein